jgi:NADH:ubiquinone oxidoreductase subunit K
MILSWVGFSLGKGSLSFLLFLAFLIFLIGLVGVLLNRKNLIIMLMSLELILLAINFILILGSFILDDVIGQLLAFFVLIIAASEVALGLALLVSYYRASKNISLSSLNLLYG